VRVLGNNLVSKQVTLQHITGVGLRQGADQKNETRTRDDL
jgi:hypothetical protein